MSGGRIAIDVDTLTAHRRRLEQIGSQVDVARDAAGSVNLGGGAFGLMCAFLVPPLQVVQTAAQASIARVASSLERAGAEVAAAAADLEAADTYGTDTYRALQADLDRAAVTGW
ncbi:hypothetical protein [Cellulomonas telluris]|uniref:hypothetical protein n=1 Tax=Cellulomonas telluris TaxID=2306636 RepID=UPI0010A7C819|nr:hypothetical protein [Cellulomonas telluris]